MELNLVSPGLCARIIAMRPIAIATGLQGCRRPSCGQFSLLFFPPRNVVNENERALSGKWILSIFKWRQTWFRLFVDSLKPRFFHIHQEIHVREVLGYSYGQLKACEWWKLLFGGVFGSTSKKTLHSILYCLLFCLTVQNIEEESKTLSSFPLLPRRAMDPKHLGAQPGRRRKGFSIKIRSRSKSISNFISCPARLAVVGEQPESGETIMYWCICNCVFVFVYFWCIYNLHLCICICLNDVVEQPEWGETIMRFPRSCASDPWRHISFILENKTNGKKI